MKNKILKPLGVKIRKFHQDAIIPKFAHDGDAGMDLYSIEEKIIKSKSFDSIRTGINVYLPNNYEGQIRSRSGLAKNNGIFVLNSPGTIDSNYTGEIIIILANFNDKDFNIEKNMRIAQLVIKRTENIEIIVTEEIIQNSTRNETGFGHSGNF